MTEILTTAEVRSSKPSRPVKHHDSNAPQILTGDGIRSVKLITDDELGEG